MHAAIPTGGSRRFTLPVDRERIDTAAGRICREYGMRERQKPVRIYDAFMFNSELDMLEVRAAPCMGNSAMHGCAVMGEPGLACAAQIRLHELYDVVDYFVITECRVTHQNAPKPLYYGDNRARFAKFEGKIIHIALDSLQGHSSYFR